MCHKARRFTEEIRTRDDVVEGGERDPGLIPDDGEETIGPPYDREETVLPAKLTTRGNDDSGS